MSERHDTAPETSPEPETSPKKEKLLGKRRFTMLVTVTNEHVAALRAATWEHLNARLRGAVSECLEELQEEGKAELAKQAKKKLELELAENRKRQQKLQEQLRVLERE